MNSRNPKNLGVLIIACLIGLSSWSHSNVSNTDTKNFDVLSLHTGENYQEVMKFLRLKGEDVLGVDYRNKIINIHSSKKRISEVSKLISKIDIVSHDEKSLDENYLTPNEVYTILKQASDKYPQITKLIKLGESLEGNSIYAIKISDEPEENDTSEPSILFNGMHHSREVMTAEVTTDIVTYLTQNYMTDSKVRDWVNNNEIYILPMLNIDGNKKVWDGNNMWRKNTRGGYGVDINRNYPTDWNKCNGSSGWRSSQTYRGSEPASEPETNVLMNFVDNIKPVFNISYHAYSELVIYPKGCKGERTSNKEVVEGIGKELGEVLDYVPGTAWEILYSVDGSDIDWMYSEQQVIPYVIEVSPRSDGFQPPYSKRDKTVQRNRLGWMHLLDRLEGPSLHGVTKNYKTVKYKKSGSKEDFNEYRINPDGSFHIILKQGEYELEFTGKTVKKMRVSLENKTTITNL